MNASRNGHSRRWSRTWLPAFVSCIMLACATATPEPETAAPPSIDEVFHEALHWSRSAAEHRAIFEQTYNLATQRLHELIEGREAGTWAVSVDADETLVDNSQYEVEINQRGESFSQESWSEWVQRRAAPALPGAVEFTTAVKAMGGVVAVVTNRRSYNCEATADNLHEAGIRFDIAMCRVDERDKEPRWEALAAGTATTWPEAQRGSEVELGAVEVLLWLGDNIGDFPFLDQEVRNRPEPLAEFGDRFFVLPNPMYGSWEDNPKQ